MDISGNILCNKVRKLRPELSSVITPEILDKVCDEPSVQPFLKWFCHNVNHINVLSNEEVRIKNSLQKTNEWLEGSALDCALEEATKNYPDLLNTISFDDKDVKDLSTEFEIIKDSYKEDKNYINVLQTGIQNLKKLETKLAEDIEKEEAFLDKECIEADKAYRDCSVVLKKFDRSNHELFKEVECLFNTYADAAENKGVPLLWTQMPLELFVKKIELYNHYLGIHIRSQFGNVDKEEQNTDSNCMLFISDSKEKHMDSEKLQELKLCKANLTSAKVEEILAKIQEKSSVTMLNYVRDIYSLGNLKLPKHSDLRTEISGLTKKRDFIEENVSLLQEQLTEAVHQFAELEITKILKQDAHTRFERRKIRLEMLKNLRFQAREHGHVHSDLLRILMEIQFHQLKDVSEFVADACHYLTTEYLLSSTRCESMQQQQNEYSVVTASSAKSYNSFNKHFISMVCSDDSVYQLNSALDKYNEYIDEIKGKKQLVLNKYLKSKIHKVEALKNDVNLQYMQEIQKGPSYIFKPVFYQIENCYSETFDNLQRVQADLSKIRSQMKERMKADMNFEREKNILWQRFLVDPETLKRTHKEVKHIANKSCFANALEME